MSQNGWDQLVLAPLCLWFKLGIAMVHQTMPSDMIGVKQPPAARIPSKKWTALAASPWNPTPQWPQPFLRTTACNTKEKTATSCDALLVNSSYRIPPPLLQWKLSRTIHSTRWSNDWVDCCGKSPIHGGPNHVSIVKRSFATRFDIAQKQAKIRRNDDQAGFNGTVENGIILRRNEPIL